MKHYFLAGLLAFICTGCLGEDGSLYSDTDLLGNWDITLTWGPPSDSRTDFNVMKFCMENREVTLCALISNPDVPNEMDLISDPASPLQAFNWSMSAAGLLSMHLEFEDIDSSSGSDELMQWNNDYFGWLDLTKQSMAGTFDHESFRDSIPEDGYSGEFFGMKQS